MNKERLSSLNICKECGEMFQSRQDTAPGSNKIRQLKEIVKIKEYPIICSDSLQDGHILAQFKIELIKQSPDNNFDKISVQIQVGLNSPRPNARVCNKGTCETVTLFV